jgi:hypothetical protein
MTSEPRDLQRSIRLCEVNDFRIHWDRTDRTSTSVDELSIAPLCGFVSEHRGDQALPAAGSMLELALDTARTTGVSAEVTRHRPIGEACISF